MIPFSSVSEPRDFDRCARVPGNAWIARHPGARRPRDLWSPFKWDLAKGFSDLCAYSAMYEASGTVDHFVSWSEDRSQAYEWDNYRYCSGWINNSKWSEPSCRLLDPFAVENGWFEIILPSLQLRVSDSIPAEFRERAEYTVQRLHLVHDERVIRQRREWYRMYECGELNLEGLRKKAPLIAAAIENKKAGAGRRRRDPRG